MEDIIDLLIQLAFELGQEYQYIYDKIGLDNIVNFNDIVFANSCGAQWNFKGDMQDLPELFKIHKQKAINELNRIANNKEEVKKLAKQQLIAK